MDYEKEIRKAKRINYIAFGIVVALTLSIIVAGLIYHYKQTFSTAKWLNNPEERTAIVGDLLDKHELIGMTEAEIIDLLGTHNNDYGYFNEADRYVYYMGPERGFISIDSEWLILDFKDGVVADCYITTD